MTEIKPGAWGAVFHRGQFVMTVLTLARAKLDGVPMHPKATLLGVICPDDLPTVKIGFVSIETMREFIGNMAPRQITVWSAPGEDRQSIELLLQRDAGVTLQ